MNTLAQMSADVIGDNIHELIEEKRLPSDLIKYAPIHPALYFVMYSPFCVVTYTNVYRVVFLERNMEIRFKTAPAVARFMCIFILNQKRVHSYEDDTFGIEFSDFNDENLPTTDSIRERVNYMEEQMHDSTIMYSNYKFKAEPDDEDPVITEEELENLFTIQKEMLIQ